MRCSALEKAFESKGIKFKYHNEDRYAFLLPPNHNVDFSVIYENTGHKACLIWEFRSPIQGLTPERKNAIHKWCDKFNKISLYNHSLDEYGVLYATRTTVLPDNAMSAIASCSSDLENFRMMADCTQIMVCDEYKEDDSSPAENAIAETSYEIDLDNIIQPLRKELNEVKMSAAAGDFSAEEAEAKIKELEQLMQILQS